MSKPSRHEFWQHCYRLNEDGDRGGLRWLIATAGKARDENEQLRKQIAVLKRRLTMLERRCPASTTATVPGITNETERK